LEIFTAKDPVFTKSKEGPCSKPTTWCTSAFACGGSATFLWERNTGNLALVVKITTFLPPLEELDEWGLPGGCSEEH
jgi:hypothetical protein